MGGYLPRPRGPDKPPEPKQPKNPPDIPTELEEQIPDLPLSQPSEVLDELAPNTQFPEPSKATIGNIRLIEQLDGNLSLSDSDTDPDTSMDKTDLYMYNINNSAADPSSHGDEVGLSISTVEAEETADTSPKSQIPFDPLITSTQDSELGTHTHSP